MLYNKKIFQRIFCFEGKYFWKNILQIPKYFKQLHFLIKNGYDISAPYDMDIWFQDVIVDVLKKYKDNHYGYPIIIEGFTFDEIGDSVTEEQQKILNENRAQWDDIVDRMIYCAQRMNIEVDNQEYNHYEKMSPKIAYKLAQQNKEEFFDFFSRYLWDLWD